MEGIDFAGVVDSDFQGIQINFALPRRFCQFSRGAHPWFGWRRLVSSFPHIALWGFGSMKGTLAFVKKKTGTNETKQIHFPLGDGFDKWSKTSRSAIIHKKTTQFYFHTNIGCEFEESTIEMRLICRPLKIASLQNPNSSTWEIFYWSSHFQWVKLIIYAS